MSNFPVEELEILQGQCRLTCHQSPHSSTGLKACGKREMQANSQQLLTGDIHTADSLIAHMNRAGQWCVLV